VIPFRAPSIFVSPFSVFSQTAYETTTLQQPEYRATLTKVVSGNVRHFIPRRGCAMKATFPALPFSFFFSPSFIATPFSLFFFRISSGQNLDRSPRSNDTNCPFLSLRELF